MCLRVVCCVLDNAAHPKHRIFKFHANSVTPGRPVGRLLVMRVVAEPEQARGTAGRCPIRGRCHRGQPASGERERVWQFKLTVFC